MLQLWRIRKKSIQTLQEYNDELMDNTPYEMWCNRLDQLIASYGVSRPTRDAEGILDSERNLVVDLGCGTGTLTELLYQKGYDCIGVDNSEEMLGIAMEKKVESGSETPLSASGYAGTGSVFYCWYGDQRL